MPTSVVGSGIGAAGYAAAYEAPKGRYYAVRTGYAGTSPAIKFRSAIFLHWEDARQFVVGAEECEAEYAAFQTFQETIAYLIEGEGGDAPAAAKDAVASISFAPPTSVKERAPAALPKKSLNSNDDTSLAPAVKKPAPAPKKKPSISPTVRKRAPAPKTLTKKKKPGISASKTKPAQNTKSNVSPIIKLAASATGATPKITAQKRKRQTAVKSNNARENAIARPKIAGEKDSTDVDGAWNHMFDRLADHKFETGSLDMKKDHEDKELVEWVKRQKSMLVLHFQGKPSGLTSEQAGRLQSLGYGQARPGIIRASGIIDVGAAEERWNGMLERLKEYKGRNGGSMSFPCDSNSMTTEDRAIKNWATEQRREYKRLRKGEVSKLTAQRMQRLDDIGFDLSPATEQVPWERRMDSLRSFVEEKGHCHVPKGHPLFTFVSHVRAKYKRRLEGQKNSLTDERVKDLEDLGFVWRAAKSPKFSSTAKKSWDERFQELVAFKEIHGHTVVPQNNTGPLGGWVRMQRVDHKKFKAGKKSTMTSERALRLMEIGFVFDASAKWSGSSKRIEAGHELE